MHTCLCVNPKHQPLALRRGPAISSCDPDRVFLRLRPGALKRDIYIYQFHILFVHTFEISESIYIDKTCMQAEFLIESDLDTSSFCRHVLREPRHTPALEQTPGIPKPPNENICSWTLGYNTTFFLGW